MEIKIGDRKKTKSDALTDEKKQARMRNKAKKELARLESIISDKNIVNDIENFKIKFSICEMVYKTLYKSKNQSSDKFIKLSMVSIPPVLKYAGYSFDNDFLISLFGTNEKQWSMSVKSVRNALTHSLSKKVICELETRKKDLNNIMDIFIKTIKEHN